MGPRVFEEVILDYGRRQTASEPTVAVKTRIMHIWSLQATWKELDYDNGTTQGAPSNEYSLALEETAGKSSFCEGNLEGQRRARSLPT